jgi:hypothetical protein
MKRRLFKKLLLSASLLLPLFASAQLSFVYDQQSSDEFHPGNGGIDIQLEQPTGQSFRPSLNQVGFVRLEVFDRHINNGLGATLYVNLRSDSITGPIIGSTIPISFPDNFGVWSNDFVTFFFTSPVHVQPGVTYFFQPVVQSGDSWFCNQNLFNYSGGSEYIYGSPSSGDYWFREGIVVPEPSTNTLVLAGTVAFWPLIRTLRRRIHGRPTKLQRTFRWSIVT